MATGGALRNRSVEFQNNQVSTTSDMDRQCAVRTYFRSSLETLWQFEVQQSAGLTVQPIGSNVERFTNVPSSFLKLNRHRFGFLVFAVVDNRHDIEIPGCPASHVAKKQGAPTYHHDGESQTASAQFIADN